MKKNSVSRVFFPTQIDTYVGISFENGSSCIKKNITRGAIYEGISIENGSFCIKKHLYILSNGALFSYFV